MEQRGARHLLIQVEDAAVAQVDARQGWRLVDHRALVSEHLNGSRDLYLFRTVHPPGGGHERHRHSHADEFLYVVSGRAAVGAGDEEHVVGPGFLHYVPAGTVHWLRNLDETAEVEVLGGYVGVGTREAAGHERVD